MAADKRAGSLLQMICTYFPLFRWLFSASMISMEGSFHDVIASLLPHLLVTYGSSIPAGFHAVQHKWDDWIEIFHVESEGDIFFVSKIDIWDIKLQAESGPTDLTDETKSGWVVLWSPEKTWKDFQFISNSSRVASRCFTLLGWLLHFQNCKNMNLSVATITSVGIMLHCC